MGKKRRTVRRRRTGRVVFGVLFIFFGIMYLVLICADAIIRSRLDDDYVMVDTTPPVLELVGGESITIAVGDTLSEPGFEVYDESSMPKVYVESNVNNKKVGEYEISYQAIDDMDNVTSAIRKVRVIQPTGRIYLTFDDGPSEYTGALLDILNKYGVKATFFVTGAGNDELIRREFREGHAIGVHSLTHNYSYIYANAENYFADFDGINNRIENLTGSKTNLMRFPGGSSNLVSAYYDGGAHIMSFLVDEVSRRGFSYFDWNVDSDDAGSASSADQVYNNVISALHSGVSSIVLQHDTKGFSVEAVERIIQYGIDNNYVFDKLRPESFTAHHGVNN